jgi:hypothetical protein
MKSIGNAVYLLIFIYFVRKIFSKVKAPLEHEIPVENRDSSDNWYIMCNGKYLAWEDSREECLVFCWNACAKCKTLSNKLKIVQDSTEYMLVAAESIPGLSLQEVVALNAQIDEME